MTDIDVYVDIGGVPVRAGVAYFTTGRQRVTTTFAYDAEYLRTPTGFDLEPALPRLSGQQYVDQMPGSFQDSSPDRWGRNLINKQRRAVERKTGSLRSVNEIDYLLGVSDLTRQGDLRFTEHGKPEFLAAGRSVPKLISLPELLHSADQVAADDTDLAAVKVLLDAGSGSLGGARPKASVQGDDGSLLIAKFPHREDDWDVMAWEKWALDLAEIVGIDVPARRLAPVGTRRVLLVERFDRRGRARVGYISAMTMLSRRDGADGDYLEIAESITDTGANVNGDLRELYRRMVFNVAIHNTDDHLRNHGFLRAPGGWKLSPIFDVNPNPLIDQQRLTSIGGATGADDEVRALLDVAGEFRLNRTDADAVFSDVVTGLATWREIAVRNQISAAEQDRFAGMITDRLSALRTPHS